MIQPGQPRLAGMLLLCLALGASAIPGRAADLPPVPPAAANQAAGLSRVGQEVPDVPGERHLAHVRMLTDGGENAEAYFSGDGKSLVFQSARNGYPCDQIYSMRADGSRVTRLSNGRGRCTCSFLAPDRSMLIYASTQAAEDTCPPRPDTSHGYVWSVNPNYEIYACLPDGSRPRVLSPAPDYDAECVFSPDGKTILFTSDRDGDLDLYTMRRDGSGLRRLTNLPGYDGGGFFSPDGRKIVFRGWHYADTTSTEAREYRDLLARHLVRPTHMEIFTCDVDGSHLEQVTRNGAANFAPFWHPDGRRILFASNQGDPRGRNFDLYLIHADGTGQEQVTWSPEFDSFPMFSPDGRHLVFSSNRFHANPGETNVFIADWKE